MNLYGHATVTQIEADYGLDIESIVKKIKEKWGNNNEQNKEKNL